MLAFIFNLQYFTFHLYKKYINFNSRCYFVLHVDHCNFPVLLHFVKQSFSHRVEVLLQTMTRTTEMKPCTVHNCLTFPADTKVQRILDELD